MRNDEFIQRCSQHWHLAQEHGILSEQTLLQEWLEGPLAILQDQNSAFFSLHTSEKKTQYWSQLLQYIEIKGIDLSFRDSFYKDLCLWCRTYFAEEINEQNFYDYPVSYFLLSGDVDIDWLQEHLAKWRLSLKEVSADTSFLTLKLLNFLSLFAEKKESADIPVGYIREKILDAYAQFLFQNIHLLNAFVLNSLMQKYCCHFSMSLLYFLGQEKIDHFILPFKPNNWNASHLFSVILYFSTKKNAHEQEKRYFLLHKYFYSVEGAERKRELYEQLEKWLKGKNAIDFSVLQEHLLDRTLPRFLTLFETYFMTQGHLLREIDRNFYDWWTAISGIGHFDVQNGMKQFLLDIWLHYLQKEEDEDRIIVLLKRAQDCQLPLSAALRDSVVKRLKKVKNRDILHKMLEIIQRWNIDLYSDPKLLRILNDV